MSAINWKAGFVRLYIVLTACWLAVILIATGARWSVQMLAIAVAVPVLGGVVALALRWVIGGFSSPAQSGPIMMTLRDAAAVPLTMLTWPIAKSWKSSIVNVPEAILSIATGYVPMYECNIYLDEFEKRYGLAATTEVRRIMALHFEAAADAEVRHGFEAFNQWIEVAWTTYLDWRETVLAQVLRESDDPMSRFEYVLATVALKYSAGCDELQDDVEAALQLSSCFHAANLSVRPMFAALIARSELTDLPPTT